jgi:hypothetical protein
MAMFYSILFGTVRHNILLCTGITLTESSPCDVEDEFGKLRESSLEQLRGTQRFIL